MKYTIFFLIILFLFSCTDWKKLYYESQLQLELCRNAPRDTVEKVNIKAVYPEMESVVIDDPKRENEPDIIIDEPLENPRKKETIHFKKCYTMKVDRDSVRVYWTIENYLIGNDLRQKIRIDSIFYPERVKIVTRYIPRKVFDEEKKDLDWKKWLKFLLIPAIAAIVLWILEKFK